MNMMYIKKMFSDNNIDARFYENKDEFIIEYRFGDQINGFVYSRSLCVNDCINYVEEVRKIIESDISSIKSRLREEKLKRFGI